MINLEKPLRGVPGLLLMAALVLFGATIGVTVALALSWVEMKDSIANFLGGVVGAGLGAALAVLGAVYVQRKDRRERLTGPRNLLLTSLVRLTTHLSILDTLVDPNQDPESLPIKTFMGASDDLVKNIERYVEDLPDGADLSRKVHFEVLSIKNHIPLLLPFAKLYFEGRALGESTEEVGGVVRQQISEMLEATKRIREALKRD